MTLDPRDTDPLYIESDPPIDASLWAGVPKTRYDRKPGIPRAVLAWTFAAVLVVLAIIAAALLVATPRAAPEASEGSIQGQPGASPERVAWYGPTSRPAASAPARHDGGAPSLPDTATSVIGIASWYCGGGSACTRGYPEGTMAAAAGPALRVGDWRGRIVRVCAGGRCIRVALVDWCACPRRVIDLYRLPFSKLASPSRGLVRVEVTWGGRSTAPLPPTSTGETP